MDMVLSRLGSILRLFVGEAEVIAEVVSAALEQHSPGCTVIIPPRKDAVLSCGAATSPSQRDLHFAEIQSEGRF